MATCNVDGCEFYAFKFGYCSQHYKQFVESDQQNQNQNQLQPLSQPSDRTATVEILPEGWQKVYTPEGKPYYQNNITKKTQWEPPATASNVPAPTVVQTIRTNNTNNNNNKNNEKKAANDLDIDCDCNCTPKTFYIISYAIAMYDFVSTSAFSVEVIAKFMGTTCDGMTDSDACDAEETCEWKSYDECGTDYDTSDKYLGIFAVVLMHFIFWLCVEGYRVFVGLCKPFCSDDYEEVFDEGGGGLVFSATAPFTWCLKPGSFEKCVEKFKTYSLFWVGLDFFLKDIPSIAFAFWYNSITDEWDFITLFELSAGILMVAATLIEVRKRNSF